MIEALAVIGVLLLVYLAFAVSASAGLGGSLVMVPTLSLFLGSKEGVALAALLLASNNVFKIWAYRKTLPFRAAAVIVLMIIIGAAIGSSLLVRAPEGVVTVAIVAMFAGTMLAERREWGVRARVGPVLAFVSGAAVRVQGDLDATVAALAERVGLRPPPSDESAGPAPATRSHASCTASSASSRWRSRA